jgi:hypothetical protein
MSRLTYRSDLFIKGDSQILPARLSSELVLDVSNTYDPGEAHIQCYPYPFEEPLRERHSAAGFEIAKILGDAGIARDDSIVVYSDAFQIRRGDLCSLAAALPGA